MDREREEERGRIEGAKKKNGGRVDRERERSYNAQVPEIESPLYM